MTQYFKNLFRFLAGEGGRFPVYRWTASFKRE